MRPTVSSRAGSPAGAAELSGRVQRLLIREASGPPAVENRGTDDLVDTPLVVRAQAGSADAIAELLRRSRPVVERTVGRLCLDRELVDDLTQTSLLVILTQLTNLRSPEAFIGWLQAIVRNVCSKEARRQGCRRAAVSRLAQHTVTQSGSRAHLVDPEDYALRFEMRAHLRAALDALPAHHRAVVAMRALDGYTYDEIGEVLDAPGQLVRLWYFRARQRLQRTCASDDVLARISSPEPAPGCAIKLPRRSPARTARRGSPETAEVESEHREVA